MARRRGVYTERRRHREWLWLLRYLDKAMPPENDCHLIVDDDCRHKHEKVQRWQRRPPRYRFYFTPTRASWLNMVERDIEKPDENPEPFIWTDILAKVKRARKAFKKVRSV